MGFREKVAWGALAIYLLVFGWYFTDFASHWQARVVSDDHGLAAIIGAIIILVVLSILLAILTIFGTPKADVRTRFDEREKLLRLRAANIAAAVVTAGVLAVIAALLMGANAVLAANVLLGALVVGDIVKAIAQIVQFRTAL